MYLFEIFSQNITDELSEILGPILFRIACFCKLMTNMALIFHAVQRLANWLPTTSAFLCW